jgi:hypothetical protein
MLLKLSASAIDAEAFAQSKTFYNVCRPEIKGLVFFKWHKIAGALRRIELEAWPIAETMACS